MQTKEMSWEELERRGILDDESIYDFALSTTTADMSLPDFAEQARALGKEINRQQGYTFTNDGALVFLFWAFFQLGSWRGAQAYRAALVERLKEEKGAELRGLPDDGPFILDDGAVAGLVSALDADGSAATIAKILGGIRLTVESE